MNVTHAFGLLKLDVDADTRSVKRAFRKAARHLHPDVNSAPGAGAAFALVREAYELALAEARRREAKPQAGRTLQGHKIVKAYAETRRPASAERFVDTYM